MAEYFAFLRRENNSNNFSIGYKIFNFDSNDLESTDLTTNSNSNQIDIKMIINEDKAIILFTSDKELNCFTNDGIEISETK